MDPHQNLGILNKVNPELSWPVSTTVRGCIKRWNLAAFLVSREHQEVSIAQDLGGKAGEMILRRCAAFGGAKDLTNGEKADATV